MPKRKDDKQSEKDREDAMTNAATEFNDLCTTCNNPPVCDSTRAGRRPVYFCEQFDTYTLPKPIRITTKPKSDSPVLANGKYKGICSNCDIRVDCMNSCTEGGIWHCEEYC